MDFYVDLAVAVLLRLVKDKRASKPYIKALAKVYNSIGNAFNPDHVNWVVQSVEVKQ